MNTAGFNRRIIHALVKIKRRIAPKFHPNRFKWFEDLYLRFLRTSRSDTAVIDGHTMLLDANDSLMLSVFGDFEVFETEFFKKILKPGDHVIDLGANIGYYTLMFARAVGPSGHVYAFEPEPENFRILSHNIRENGYENVSLYNMAASDHAGETALYLSKTNAGDHRILSPGGSRKKIMVRTGIPDQVLGPAAASAVSVIKMDIQGSEPAAFKGMEKICSKNDLCMVTEFSPMHLAGAGFVPGNFLDVLSEKGLSLYRMDETSKSIMPLSKESLLSKLTRANRRFTNILCVKGSFDGAWQESAQADTDVFPKAGK